jgi:hypothetical protein
MVKLTTRSPKYEYTFRNNAKLWTHQKQELYQMQRMEMGKYIVDEKEITTSFGVLGSACGSGKTATLLALIECTYNIDIEKEPIPIGCSVASVTSINKEEFDYTRVTLVIVPNHLESQWEKEMNRCGIVFSKGELTEEQDEKVCLVTSNTFNRFSRKHGDMKFKRIIVDEADNIKIPLERFIENDFIWFVTCTPSSLFYQNKFRRTRELYLKYFNNFKYDWMVNDYFIVETNEDTIRNVLSINNNIRRIVHTCLEVMPSHSRMSQKARSYFNSKKFVECLSVMNYKYNNQDEYLKSLDITINDNRRRKEVALKVKDIKNETCSICYDELVDEVVVTNCCYNMFCSECMCKNFTMSNSCCPICRKYDFNGIIIGDNTIKNRFDSAKPTKNILSKNEQLVKIMKGNPRGRVMVFDMWNVGFSELTSHLHSVNLCARIMNGRVDQIIDRHKDGYYDTLFANQYHFGPGIHLPYITDVVFCNRQSIYMEDYVINKLLVDRKKSCPLTIHYLFAESEMS